VRAVRICQARFAARSLDGEGARLHGGRWTSKGRPVVYAASSAALAALEILMHMPFPALLAARYSLIELEFPEEIVLDLGRTALPADWRGAESPALKALGDTWLIQGSSAVLRVPSAVVPREDNLLLNPLHPNFSRVRASAPEPFLFDPRLGG